MIFNNDKIYLFIPNIAIVKIAISRKGMRDMRNEYHLSKSELLNPFVLHCKTILLGGVIGIYEYVRPMEGL